MNSLMGVMSKSNLTSAQCHPPLHETAFSPCARSASSWRLNHHLYWLISGLQATPCIMLPLGHPLIFQNDLRVMLFKSNKVSLPGLQASFFLFKQSSHLFYFSFLKVALQLLLTTLSCTGSCTHLKLLCLASYPRFSCKENRTLKSEPSWAGQLPSQLLLLNPRSNGLPLDILHSV